MISSSESRLALQWRQLNAGRHRALIPYFTAGYPTLELSREALRAADGIADIIEVGVPFSDPLADGPTIQASTFGALANGMTLPKTLELIASSELVAPVVLFTYLNPILQYGVEQLLADAAAIGVAGLLVTDLPAGADVTIEELVTASELDLIRLVAPNTRPDRMRSAVDGAGGFIYLIARLGVTGASDALASDLGASVARVRAATALPVAVGFGVSTPAQARAVGAVADGVVVGSALVAVLGRDGVAASTRLLTGMRAALDEG